VIVLLHGLHASPAQLKPLATHLEREGHRVATLDFPTRRGLAESLAVARAQLERAAPSGEVRLVGFSFGSLVARGLAHELGERCRLLVQVAPPNRGAAWAGRFSRAAGLHGGLRDLAPGSAALAALPVPACPIAIVAGTGRASLRVPLKWPAALGNALLGIVAPGDGVVTLAETELPQGREIDRVLLPYAHDELPTVPELHVQVNHVLDRGMFRR
jgi:pimeloyl-ACP methyl ester carboxylesterase